MFSMEQEAASAEVGATEKGEASPSDIRFAEETERQLTELLNGMAGMEDPHGDLASLRAQLATMAGQIGAAVQSRSSQAAPLASNAVMLVAISHSTITTAVNSQKEAGGKAAREAIHALEVAQTQHYLERTIDGFDKLSEPAKEYFAKDVQDMLDKDPVLKKAMQMSVDIESDPALKEELEKGRKKAKDAYEGLHERAEQDNSDAGREMGEHLDRIEEAVGIDEESAPAELIDVNEKLQEGKINIVEAKDAVKEVADKTERAVNGIMLKCYSELDEGQRVIIAESLGKTEGEKVTAEDLKRFLKDNKDKLTPEQVNMAFARFQQGNATENDKLVLAGYSLQLKSEMGKGIYNIASHMVEMEKRDPEKLQQFMKELGERYDAGDSKAVIETLEKYGITNAEGISPLERQALDTTMKTLSHDQAFDVLKTAMQGVKGGNIQREGTEIQEIFREAIADKAGNQKALSNTQLSQIFAAQVAEASTWNTARTEPEGLTPITTPIALTGTDDTHLPPLNTPVAARSVSGRMTG